MTQELRSYELLEMPVAWLERYPRVPKRPYAEEVTERLRRNMLDKEFLPSNPLTVVALGFERYGVTKGNHRLEVAQEIGLEYVPVVIDETFESVSELVFDAGMDNLTQQPMGPVGISLFINEVYLALREEHSDWSDTTTLEHVADKWGFSKKWIGGYRRVMYLPEKVQDLIRKNKLSKTIAIQYLTTLIGTPHEVMLTHIADDIMKRQIRMREMPWFLNELRATGIWPNTWPGQKGQPSYIGSSCSPEDREKCLYVEACRKGGFKIG